VTQTQFVPRRAHTIGMALFLVSLSILFSASLLGYVFIRVYSGRVPLGSIHLPKELWVSTVMMLAASYTMHRALVAIRRERQPLFRLFLSATLVLAAIFVAIQTPAMVKLYRENQTAQKQWARQQAVEQQQDIAKPNPEINVDESIPSSRSTPFYALVMFLILIHALHVVGGMVALGIVSYNGYHNRYDHENYVGVQNCVVYWHFLDIVWIIMFAVVGAFG